MAYYWVVGSTSRFTKSIKASHLLLLLWISLKFQEIFFFKL